MSRTFSQLASCFICLPVNLSWWFRCIWFIVVLSFLNLTNVLLCFICLIPCNVWFWFTELPTQRLILPLSDSQLLLSFGLGLSTCAEIEINRDAWVLDWYWTWSATYVTVPVLLYAVHKRTILRKLRQPGVDEVYCFVKSLRLYHLHKRLCLILPAFVRMPILAHWFEAPYHLGDLIEYPASRYLSA